jgi:hypothetical protein
LLAARETLGLAAAEGLIAEAVELLSNGWDSRSLVLLAGLLRSEAAEAPALFDRALSELGLERPRGEAAVMLLARECAAQICSGATSPYEGARRIWMLSRRAEAQLPALDPFVYAASEWEDRPEDRAYFETAIKGEARDLLGG